MLKEDSGACVCCGDWSVASVTKYSSLVHVRLSIPKPRPCDGNSSCFFALAGQSHSPVKNFPLLGLVLSPPCLFVLPFVLKNKTAKQHSDDEICL